MLLSHDVDWDALKLMKEAHLKELGFPMGPRVKIINSLKGWLDSNSISGPPGSGPLSAGAGAGIGAKHSESAGNPAPRAAPPGLSAASGPSSLARMPAHAQHQPFPKGAVPRDYICPLTRVNTAAH